MTSEVGLVFVNAHVLTMDRSTPVASAVAVEGERIAAAGSNSDILRLASRSTRVIDCQGLTLLPGFNDAHIHLPGLARRMQDLDCSPDRAPSIRDLLALVWNSTTQRERGSWVRGRGYDDQQVEEGRHPTRWDLDTAAPNHPVWIEHRSGHAAALNSMALAMAGIDSETPDPPGGVIERDAETGVPTGVLFEAHSFLRQRLGNLRSPREFEQGMRAAGQLLSSYGITSVQDAGADNGIERWQMLQRMKRDGVLACRIRMFAGASRLEEFTREGLAFDAGDSGVRLGHAKIMATVTSGRLHPPVKELESLVKDAHRARFPVAIHCVEEEVIAAAARVLESCRESTLRDRIEHCSEGTPALIETVKRSGVSVVTNPGFLYHNGARYRENVEARLLPHLYPAGALKGAGVAVAFGSDAPVIDPNPWAGIYGAVTRRDSEGRQLTAEEFARQKVDIAEALRMYTVAGAKVEGSPEEKGAIIPGRLADVILVDGNPLEADANSLLDTRTVMTFVSGSIVWSKN